MLDVTENIFLSNLEEAPQSPQGPRRRKPIIEDGRIWNDRDHLVWLLEVTWPDVGGRLPRIKTPADVLEVLQAWQGRSNNYIVETLLRKESSPATATILNRQRHQLGSLHIKSLEAWESREKCRESLEVAERAFSPQLTEREKSIVEEQRTKRAAKLVQADKLYAASKDREDKLDKLLKEGEAHFARVQFIEFCQSRRYRLTAVNTANALAGLPFIGWRQSSLRCAQQQAQGANGGAMQVFDTIRRIVASRTRKAEVTAWQQVVWRNRTQKELLLFSGRDRDGAQVQSARARPSVCDREGVLGAQEPHLEHRHSVRGRRSVVNRSPLPSCVDVGIRRN